MAKVSKIIVVLVLLSSILSFKPAAHAAEALKWGEVEAKPWGEVRLQYDDNVFFSPDEEKDDFIITLIPGITVEWPIDDNRLLLDYHLAVSKFLDHGSQDATNHYLYGEADINWQDVGFTVYNDFSRVFERPSTEDTQRVERDDNRTGIKARIERERLGIELGFEHFIRNYRSSDTYEIYDRQENIYSILLTHHTFPKTDLLFEYDFAQIRYDEDTRSDGDYHQFLIGAIGELTPKTTATIKTGYQMRDYDRESEPDFNTGVLYADITHKLTEKDAIKVSFLRSAHESTYSVNNFYTLENVSATYDHYFTYKLLGFLTGLYQINSYPRETTEGTETMKREDKYYSLGAGLRYYMRKWLTLTLQVDHIERDSNFSVYDYNQNLVTFTARAEF